LQTINLNQAMRDVSLELDPSQSQQFFEALHHFAQILNSPKNLLKFKIQPGEQYFYFNQFQNQQLSKNFLHICSNRANYCSTSTCDCSCLGEMVVFNNRRVLHGRTAYQGGRYLESCFLGLDEIKSRLRVLLKQEERKKRQS
jgi:hypothetical protein